MHHFIEGNCTITEDGKPCVTPFKVKILGSVYNSCTNDVFERSWCPLKVDSEGFVDLLDRDNIGLCNPGCSSNSKVIIKVWFWHFWLTFHEFQFLRNPNPLHQVKVLFWLRNKKVNSIFFKFKVWLLVICLVISFSFFFRLTYKASWHHTKSICILWINHYQFFVRSRKSLFSIE